MSRSILAVVALLSGVGLAIQVGMNSALRERVGNPILAALISFAIGTLLLAGYVVAAQPARPSLQAAGRGPWWIWMGGVMGAAYVTAAAAYGRQLGALAWLGLTIAGQVLASIVLDHFGLIGFEPHPVSLPRVLGAGLLIGGVVLILRW